MLRTTMGFSPLYLWLVQVKTQYDTILYQNKNDVFFFLVKKEKEKKCLDQALLGSYATDCKRFLTLMESIFIHETCVTRS